MWNISSTFALSLTNFSLLRYKDMKDALEHEDGVAVVAILLTQTDTAYNYQLEQV